MEKTAQIYKPQRMCFLNHCTELNENDSKFQQAQYIFQEIEMHGFNS